MRAIGDRVRSLTELTELFVPFERGDILAAIHREGQVLSEATEPDGLRVRARLEAGSVGRLRPFVVGDGVNDGGASIAAVVGAPTAAPSDTEAV